MKLKSLYLASFLVAFPTSAIFALDHTSHATHDQPLVESVGMPGNEEVCFSPDEHCAEKLVKLVSSAKKSLDVAIYDINIENLVDLLINKAKTIEVRIVCDKKQAAGSHSLIHHMLENGVNVHYGKQKGIMHDKFVIVDGAMIETGSFNYTNHARLANQENQIYLTSSKIVDRYVDRFEKMWSSSVEINKHELLKEKEAARNDADTDAGH